MILKRKKRTTTSLDLDDYRWAKLQGSEFSRRFMEYLKAARHQADAATY